MKKETKKKTIRILGKDYDLRLVDTDDPVLGSCVGRSSAEWACLWVGKTSGIMDRVNTLIHEIVESIITELSMFRGTSIDRDTRERIVVQLTAGMLAVLSDNKPEWIEDLKKLVED